MAAHESVRIPLPKPADAPASTTTAPPVRRRATPAQPAVLTVGSADDAMERAADRAADDAMARIAGDHRHGPGCGHDTSAQTAPTARRTPIVGRAGGATTADFTSRVERMRPTGRTLDDDVRRRMETGFGTSLSGVRIHTGTDAAEAAAEIGSRAFTTGKDIFFGAGQYRPGTPDGDHMIGHEIAHTLQQSPATRRISRLWEFNPFVPLNITDKARELSPLTSDHRDVFTATDRSGEKLVVKSEDQPVGLGELIGTFHSALNETSTVQYRKFSRMDVADFATALRTATIPGNTAKWAARYDTYASESTTVQEYFDQAPDPAVPLTPDVKARTARAVLAKKLIRQVMAGETNLLGMSWAAGDTAGAQGDAGNGLAILDKPGHMKKLGILSVIDIVFGNFDRINSEVANDNNWMLTPDGDITLIDNIDGSPRGTSMAEKWRTGQLTKPDDSDALPSLAPSELAATAAKSVRRVVRAMNFGYWTKQNLKPVPEMDKALKQPSPAQPGKTRGEVYNAEFEEGLKEGRKKLIKIFGARRRGFRKSSRDAHKMRKTLKAATEKAQHDDEDNTTGYWQILESRVALLKSLT